MSDGRLLPCSSCARHVRASEETCPFCDAALDVSRGARVQARPPVGRLKRAALFALGGTAAAVAACGGTTTTTGDGGAGDGGDELVVRPAYGGPPSLDGGEDAPFLVDAAYGGPPQDGATDAADADSSPAPLYGAPPP